MDAAHENLAEEIAHTLRDIIHVPPLRPSSLWARPEFWQRCKLLNPEWRHEYPNWIFVDGFLGRCHWNSWKVFNDKLEDGLRLWLGYACYGLGWSEHSWCILGDRIIETTGPFRIYYGAELLPDELKAFADTWGDLELAKRGHLKVCTMIDGDRRIVPYDSAEYAQSIGRERDPKTREIKEGLGR